MSGDIYYGLGLHMHQPPENLDLLEEYNEWEAHQIIRCYERAARYAHEYSDVGFFHVGFSGILLEQFKDPRIIDRYRKFVDIPRMIDSYKTAEAIEIIGMGYYHPIFPLIPHEDWSDQLEMGLDIAEELFGKRPKGFWPSEMAFTMEMVPALVKAGYEYVVVDHVHVKPDNCDGIFDCFQPYKAVYEDSEITVIPRNRDISNAQESGLNPDWFIEEVDHKIFQCPNCEKSRLVTTWSDGENGGWFRQMDESNGFFGFFYAPLMEKIRKGECIIKPIKFSDYLKENKPTENACVKTGAWNVASTSGYDFSQWNGSESQRRAIEELIKTSAKYWELSKRTDLDQFGKERLAKARHIILEAETSCYLFWGEAWLPKLYERIQEARELLG